MSGSDDDESFNPLTMFGPEQQELLMTILAAKNGMPSNLPSAFLQDEVYEEPYTLEEIKADPRKHILWAAEHNELKEAEELVREKPALVNTTDDDAYTPLHRASYNGHLEMMKFLLTNGADINAKTLDGWQPFHSACRWDNVDAAKLLGEQGADIHALTNGNNTALHLAASNGEAEAMIKYLVHETDIDLSVVNAAGDTAEQVARRNSHFYKHFKRDAVKGAKQVTKEGDNSDHGANSAKSPLKVVIVPGNGGGEVYRANWYGWVYNRIRKVCNVECRLENMPDPVFARESAWIPFMKNSLECDENTIVVGHSSGAAAAMRYAEEHKLHAIVLVSAYVSDLGDETEAKSGYFNRPWLWEKMKRNCKYIVQFGSSDDPFLPWEEQEKVAKETGAEFHASDRDGHFMCSKFPALLDTVNKLIKRKDACGEV